MREKEEYYIVEKLTPALKSSPLFRNVEQKNACITVLEVKGGGNSDTKGFKIDRLKKKIFVWRRKKNREANEKEKNCLTERVFLAEAIMSVSLKY